LTTTDYSLITKSSFSFGDVDADRLLNQGAITKSKISFGDGNSDIVVGSYLSNNTISFGDGDNDFVGGINFSNNKISFGNGGGDRVYAGGAGDHNIIKMGNGDGDVVDLRFDTNDTITVGTGNLVQIHMGTDTTATVGKHGGIDTFYFTQTTQGDIGSAKIYNFDIAKDIIEISMSGSYSSHLDHCNTVITFAGDPSDTITLVGVQAINLDFVIPSPR
jgi:hypothetical protein